MSKKEIFKAIMFILITLITGIGLSFLLGTFI